MRKLVQAVALATAVISAFPAFAQATFIPGPNGKIAYASGRANAEFPAPADNDDGNARIWVFDYKFGTPVQATTLPAGQHRHPNWSPDHTKIVYAAGVAFSGEYALWIKNLEDKSSFEFVPKAKGQDRPSWSPDGTRIAYGSQGDLWVKAVAPGSTPVNLTSTSDFTEERPVWSPDGNTLYYNREAVPADGNKRDLTKISPVSTSGTETPVLSGATDDWQPALSPAGNRLCFLRGPQSDGADLWTVGVDGSLPAPYATSGIGDLNCVWSPDGTEILYTLGQFSTGQLIFDSVNGGASAAYTNNVAKHFDGNADWATNFSPECESRNLNVGVNQFTTVQLACTDPDFGFGIQPPSPEPIENSGIEIVSPPKNGTIGGISDNEQVVYTPNKDFKGTDTFTYTGQDNASQAEPAKVTINVGAGGDGGGDKIAPKISGVKVSPKLWSLGTKLAKISLAPVGTTISFRINEAAKTTLTFQRKLRKGGKTTYKTAGKITRQAKAGNRKVKFQGRLSKKKSLKPGAYRVVVGAVDGSGNRAKAVKGPTFTIVTD